jgi:subtilisin family serine protease
MLRRLALIAVVVGVGALDAAAQDALVFFGPATPPGIAVPGALVPDEFVVVFDPDTAAAAEVRVNEGPAVGIAALDALAQRFGVQSIRKQFTGADPQRAAQAGLPDLSGYYLVKFNDKLAKLDDVMAAYRANPNVRHVEPIGIHPVYITPNDGYYAQQWHLNQGNDKDIDAPEAWDIETGDPSIAVAVLDTGVRYYHKDLGGSGASPSNPNAADGNIWRNLAEVNGAAGVDDDGNGFVDDRFGWDWVTGVTGCWSGEDCSTADNDPRDFNGHGTHCAGNVAAINNNGYATASPSGGWGNGTLQPTGNGVKVMALRIGWSGTSFGQEVGFVRMDFAASAFYYAANNGARIASCSWGSSNSGGIAAAVDYFVASGGLIFVAAGNSNNQSAGYLNSRSDCYSVAATNQSDQKASFSSYGTWVDISAPGVAIWSSYHNHNDPTPDYVAALDGTSMATPLTAGTAAAVWSHNLTWTAAQVWTQVRDSADNINAQNPSYVGLLGSGRINLFNAVNTGPTPGCQSDPECDDGNNCNGVEVCNAGTCQPGALTADCNSNGVEDSCDISGGSSQDCQPNGIPDECEGGNPCAVPGPKLLLAFTATTTVPGVGAVENEDIVAYDTGTGQYSLYFDGSDVGLAGFAIDALAVLSGGDLLISLDVAGNVSGLVGGPDGTLVDDSDIIQFTPASLGASTSGTWTFYLDGSDVDLTTDNEDIDGLSISSSGALLVSTLGAPSVSGLSSLQGADVIQFTPTLLGASTSGTWSYYVDGSDVGLNSANENIDAVSTTPTGPLLFSTNGNFSVPGLSGVDEDVFQFAPTSLGANTAGTYSSLFVGLSAGLPAGADVSATELIN